MHSKQRGITMIGWLFLLIPIAIVGYAGVRLTPIYLNYMKVARSLEQTAKQHAADGDSTNQADIRNTLEKHFDVESVDFPKVRDVIIRREGRTWVMQTVYEDATPLFGSISMLIKFDKTVEIK